MMKEIPDKITLCNLECVLMPNGEIISMGEGIGCFDKFKRYLSIKVEDEKEETSAKVQNNI